MLIIVMNTHAPQLSGEWYIKSESYTNFNRMKKMNTYEYERRWIEFLDYHNLVWFRVDTMSGFVLIIIGLCGLYILQFYGWLTKVVLLHARQEKLWNFKLCKTQG